MTPVRIQLSRKAGFNLQAHSRSLNGLDAVNVARPSKWGNPFRIGDFGIPDQEAACTRYHEWLDGRVVGTDRPNSLEALRGKNLACWCKPGEPCHADILLELANEVDVQK